MHIVPHNAANLAARSINMYVYVCVCNRWTNQFVGQHISQSAHQSTDQRTNWHWSLFPQPSARHQLTLRDNGYGTDGSRCVPVYVIFVTPNHGRMARLSWVAGYIRRLFTHPSTNRARRWQMFLIKHNVLTQCYTKPLWNQLINQSNFHVVFVATSKHFSTT